MKDSQMLEPAELLTELQRWSDAGWIRRLDRAFAAFMLDLSPQCEAPVLLAAALLAHMEGRGHSCLALDELLANPAELLGWPPLAADSLRLTLQGLPAEASAWLSALQRSPLVWEDGGASASASATAADGSAASPLVLRGTKLYLRRYWACEQRVASQVLQRAALQQPV
ncbi:exodeoxyribonuclease V subunit alpha, partial [Roseateles sp. GG27B]